MDMTKALQKELKDEGGNVFIHEMNIQEVRELDINNTELTEALDNAQADVFGGNADLVFFVIAIKA